MPEAVAFQPALIGFPEPEPEPIALSSDSEVGIAAESFCRELPYRQRPYAQRNWGGALHSLCSYQGKLKPAIAHFLVKNFSHPGDVILDPMSGVGTIPLEARLQGRTGLAGDLSELATIVTRAKLEPYDHAEVADLVSQLADLFSASSETMSELAEREHAGFGMNGAVSDYFEERTLREVLLARRFFRERITAATPAEAVVITSLLHILHGNRPYALSRRSHPVTPFKPTGPYEYRPVTDHLVRRLERIAAPLTALAGAGEAHLSSYESLPIQGGSVDAVITSPPFAQSLRFHASNWLRLWFCGWSPDDFAERPSEFLDRQQKLDFEHAYSTFLEAMGTLVRPRGLLILHLGATKKLDMAERLLPVMSGSVFEPVYLGRECVADTESHGLTDKGSTLAHMFLFARRSS